MRDHRPFDFTEGPVMRQMVAFAAPTFFANILQASYHFVDSLWVGNLLGSDALAAVTLSSPVVFTILAFIIGMNSASLTILSQARGRRDEEGLRQSLNAFVVILGLLTVVLGAIGIAASSAILRWLGAPVDLMPTASAYLRILFAGIPFLFGYTFMGTILRALGDSRTPLRIVGTAVALHVALDPLFIAGFGWGVPGAAAATLVSQGTAFVWGLTYAIRRLRVPFSVPRWPPKEYALEVIRLGVPGGLQMISVSSGMVAVMGVVAGFGKSVLAGFGAVQRIESMMMLPGQTLGSVVNSMAGQNIGAGRWDRVRTITRDAMLLIIGASAVMGAICFFGSGWLVRLFTDDPEAVEFGVGYLRTVSLFFVLVGFNFVMNGITRAAGAMFAVLALNILSLWVLRYPLVALMSERLGPSGIAWGFAASFALSFLAIAAYFLTGRWRRARLHLPGRDKGPNGTR